MNKAGLKGMTVISRKWILISLLSFSFGLGSYFLVYAMSIIFFHFEKPLVSFFESIVITLIIMTISCLYYEDKRKKEYKSKIIIDNIKKNGQVNLKENVGEYLCNKILSKLKFLSKIR